MFTNEDLEIAYSILKQIQPKLAESIIFYKKSDQPDYGHVVKYIKEKHTTAVWLDFKDLNQWMLKILFTKHKQVNHAFFIQEIANYYRVGWKIRRTG
jgi:hypoxanthine phosphoribosyltransferase